MERHLVTEETTTAPVIPVEPLVSAEETESAVTETDSVRADAEAIAKLNAVMKRETQKRVAMIVLLPLVPFLLSLLSALLSQEQWIRLCTNPFFLIPLIFGVGFLPLNTLRRFRKARDAANTLANMDDVRAVGPLLDGLQFTEDRSVSEPAYAALIRLLPRLRASDGVLLNARRRTALRQLLVVPHYIAGNLFTPSRQRQAHAELQIAILEALEQIGDEKDLPVVQHLAEGKAKTDLQKRVQEAAQECLPFLQARINEQSAPRMLLRASGIAETAPDVLLRPASGSGGTDARQLLRPDESETVEEASLP